MRSGLLLINKPEGPSSFDIIRGLRRNLRIKKMGHAGTLDPLASGLLVIAVGEATKILSHIPTEPKRYEFTIQFGETRTTGDREGEVLEDGFSTPTQESLEEILPNFTGEITQVPPAFSAVKIDGKRAYELAREGKEVKMKERTITIHSLELLSFDSEKASANMVVECSTGTYVRSLAGDIAKALQSGAYASRIHRTQIGAFSLSDAQNPDEVLEIEQLQNPVPLLSDWPSVSITEEELLLIRNGNPISNSIGENPYLWVTHQEIPVALAKSSAEYIKPIRVFPNW